MLLWWPCVVVIIKHDTGCFVLGSVLTKGKNSVITVRLGHSDLGSCAFCFRSVVLHDSSAESRNRSARDWKTPSLRISDLFAGMNANYWLVFNLSAELHIKEKQQGFFYSNCFPFFSLFLLIPSLGPKSLWAFFVFQNINRCQNIVFFLTSQWASGCIPQTTN